MKNNYLKENVAANYERERFNTNYKRYKHFAEVESLLEHLQNNNKPEIIEVGCGTGRITQELINRGFSVTPTDVSPAMLSEFAKKKGLPKPVLTKDSILPFPKNSYKAAVSLRVVWHILNKVEREKFIFELIRVTSGDIIVDFTNRDRVKNKFIRLIITIFTRAFPQGYGVYEDTYFFDIRDLGKFLEKKGLKIQKTIPMDTITPVWLNLLSEKAATNLFPIILKIDRLSAKIIPPTRYLLRISKK